MAFANKSLAQINTAYTKIGILSTMLQAYTQGHPAPAVDVARFPVADIEAAITAAKSAIDAINAA